MGCKNRIKIENLPESYRRQAEAQLSGNSGEFAPTMKPVVQEQKTQCTTKRATRRLNKTEQRFANDVLPGRGFRSIHPQAMVLAFPCGDSYRPDFVALDDTGRMFVYEVKARGWLRDPRSKAGIQKYRRAKEQFRHVHFTLAVLEDNGRWTMEALP